MRVIAGLAILWTGSAAADTLEVGPGKPFATPCAAIGSAAPGDTIEVDAAGNYAGDTCAWSTDDLTVRGVGGGRAHIDLTGVAPAQGKGIFTIAAPNATIENFEFSGAAISAADGNNGAGIRHQGTNLTVRGCYFHDNQDGILGAPATDGSGDVLIETSEFANNGAGDGFSHNMYLNHYASFTLRASYSHGAVVGHLVKSRAEVNVIEYDRITDEAGTTASYEIDLPNGGTAYLIGNVIEQSAASQNPTIVSSGEEGTTNADQHFYFVNNTVVNDLGGGDELISLASGTTAVVQNDVFAGGGAAPATAVSSFVGATADAMLADAASYDYHLVAGSPCVDAGTLPGLGVDGRSLVPDHEYAGSAGDETRGVVGAAIDIGAFELGGGGLGGGSGDGGASATGDAAIGGAGGGPGGGCCSASGDDARGAGAIALLAWLGARRRRRAS